MVGSTTPTPQDPLGPRTMPAGQGVIGGEVTGCGVGMTGTSAPDGADGITPPQV